MHSDALRNGEQHTVYSLNKEQQEAAPAQYQGCLHRL